MKMTLWNPQLSFLLLIFGQLNVGDVRATWPSLNSSGIQLLGLFPDEVNTTDPTELSVHSRAMFKAAILLSQQYNITIEEQLIDWQTAQTGGNAIGALSSTCQVISTSNIVGIVGPAFSRETPIIADFANKIGIPVVSYAATAPDLSDRNVYHALYRTVPSDYSAAMAIVKLFIGFNWTSCVIIYQNDEFGSGGAKVINDAFINNGLTVKNTLVFDIATGNFRDDLKNTLTGSSTRIVLLWAFSSYTHIILQKAIDSDVLGPQFTWILSSSISLNSFNQTFYPKLIGMLTVEPVIASVVGASSNTVLLNAAYNIWKQYEPETFPESTEVNYYALFAFDATWLLIQSLQELCSTTTMNNSFSCTSFIDSSFCFNRRFLNSNSFFNTINNMKFIGVSGPIQFNINVTDRINGSYYFAQNSQIYSDGMNFVPVLGYSEHDGWQRYAGASTIIWPGGTLSVPTGLAKLNGVSLRIGVISSVPYTIVSTVTDQFGQTKQTFTGYAPDLINLLQTRMGFIPNIQLAPTNLGYDAVVQTVAAGIYDIVVGDVTVTSARREIVDFSNAIYDNSLVIVMRKDFDNNVDLLAFLKPFSHNLWLLTFIATITGGILFYLLEKEDNEVFQSRSIISLLAMSIWYCFGNLVGYGAGFHAMTAAGRLLTVGFYILSLVLVASYTANLASYLTLSKSKGIISGLDDIKSGKIPSNRIGIRVGSASEAFYLREISDGRRNYYALKNKPETYNCLLNNTIDLTFMDIGVAEYITNNVYCNFTIVGEDFNKGIMSIVTPKQWLYAQDLDINILALRELGELDRLKSKWIDTKSCPAPSQISSAMEIESMSGLFLVFAIICSLSILLFIWKKRQIMKDRLATLVNRYF